MLVQIECGKITCKTCNHEMWVAPIYEPAYYQELVCSECNNKYLDEPIKEETEQITTEEVIEDVKSEIE